MTGDDPAADLREKYDSARGAARALRQYGDGTLLRTITGIFGEPISPNFAQRGDIVMLDRATTGICVGRFSWFVGQEDGFNGLLHRQTSACRYAFRLPYGGGAA